jgi:predicted ATP-dependent protease
VNLDSFETTADLPVTDNPFDRIIGQEMTVTLIKSAVTQRRHVLLCGVPGIGKSMLAKAAYSLLPRPKQEVRVRNDHNRPDRPRIHIVEIDEFPQEDSKDAVEDIVYARPEHLRYDVAIEMGFRCPRCGSFTLPVQGVCMDCGSSKRRDWSDDQSYHGLFHALDILRAPAKTSVVRQEEIDGQIYHTTYQRTENGSVKVTRSSVTIENDSLPMTYEDESILVARSTPRFIRVSGNSPAELLGDVKHDPYGSATTLGTPTHRRIVPGAIHEAHEGILYIDEIATLGVYQKHLLTAMQDRTYPISGHNPQSSGAAVRVEDVPCDFLLFASCNTEDLPNILAPLRSRIRGYGYEVVLPSWTERTSEREQEFARFIAQTVYEDGRIPHLSSRAVESVLKAAEEMAFRFEGKRNALTLRLRELGGLIRIAGDLAVQDNQDITLPVHIERAAALSTGIDTLTGQGQYSTQSQTSKSFGDYFL